MRRWGLAVFFALVGLVEPSMHADFPACTPTCYLGFEPPQGHGTSPDGRPIVNIFIDPAWNQEGTPPTTNPKIWNAVARAVEQYNNATNANEEKIPYYLKVDQQKEVTGGAAADITVAKGEDCLGQALACSRGLTEGTTVNGSTPSRLLLSANNLTVAPDQQPADPQLDSLAGRIAHEIAHKFGMNRKGSDPVGCVGATIVKGVDNATTGWRLVNTVQQVDVSEMRAARYNTSEKCTDIAAATEAEPTSGGGGGSPDEEPCDPGGLECPFGYFWSNEIAGCLAYSSPIIIGTHGNIRLSSAADGVEFDVTGTGVPKRYAWPLSKNTGFLVLDRNGNGIIDNGWEMFGTSTLLASGGRASNGFEALAEFDQNGDGWIDASDWVYSRLRWWVDADRDGYSVPDELQTLGDAGIARIRLVPAETQERDKWENWYRFVAPVVAERSRRPRSAFDVYLTWMHTGIRPRQAMAPCQ